MWAQVIGTFMQGASEIGSLVSGFNANEEERELQGKYIKKGKKLTNWGRKQTNRLWAPFAKFGKETGIPLYMSAFGKDYDPLTSPTGYYGAIRDKTLATLAANMGEGADTKFAQDEMGLYLRPAIQALDKSFATNAVNLGQRAVGNLGTANIQHTGDISAFDRALSNIGQESILDRAVYQQNLMNTALSWGDPKKLQSMWSGSGSTPAQFESAYGGQTGSQGIGGSYSPTYGFYNPTLSGDFSWQDPDLMGGASSFGGSSFNYSTPLFTSGYGG